MKKTWLLVLRLAAFAASLGAFKLRRLGLGSRLRSLLFSVEDDCAESDGDSVSVSEWTPRPDVTRFVGRVMYDGAGFRGWQDQDKRLRTVQGTMNRAFRQRFDSESVHVTGSSRTDFGVHARGQAFHFDLPAKEASSILSSTESHSKFEYTMNRLLPDDIRIYNVTWAPVKYNEPFFHAIASAKAKHYSYKFCLNDFVEPSQRRYCSHFYKPIDLQLFEESLKCFVGTHDFSAFANKIEHNTRDFNAARLSKFSARRNIMNVSLSPEEGLKGYYRIDFYIGSALYRMLRNIVGTSKLVGEGKMPLQTLKDLIERHPSRRDNPSKSAPPEGLTLESVYFDHYGALSIPQN